MLRRNFVFVFVASLFSWIWKSSGCKTDPRVRTTSCDFIRDDCTVRVGCITVDGQFGCHEVVRISMISVEDPYPGKPVLALSELAAKQLLNELKAKLS